MPMYDTPKINTVRSQAMQTMIDPNNVQQNQSLRACVERILQNYFAELGDQMPNDLYDLVLAEVEVPLLEVTLQKTRGNQTRTAKILGLSRGTLRKKLKQYDLD